jgi:hypothetical protein
MKRSVGRPSILSLQQRMAVRRRVIEERKRGGGRIVAVMEEMAREHHVSFGVIRKTVYG